MLSSVLEIMTTPVPCHLLNPQLQRRSSLWVPHCGASPAPWASVLGTRPAGRPGALGSDACDACRASGPVAGAPHGAAPRLTTTVCVRRPDTGFSSPGRTADLAPVLQQPERGHTPAGASDILVPKSKGLARPAPRTPPLCVWSPPFHQPLTRAPPASLTPGSALCWHVPRRQDVALIGF